MHVRFAATLAGLLLAPGAHAACEPPFSPLFYCEIPERAAEAEFCENSEADTNGRPAMQYTYRANGKVELSFQTDDHWFGTRSETRGIPGGAIGNGLVHGKAVYAFYMDDIVFLQPRSAQIHVYASIDDFNNRAEPVARRYCYPPSIFVTQEGIGP